MSKPIIQLEGPYTRKPPPMSTLRAAVRWLMWVLAMLAACIAWTATGVTTP